MGCFPSKPNPYGYERDYEERRRAAINAALAQKRQQPRGRHNHVPSPKVSRPQPTHRKTKKPAPIPSRYEPGYEERRRRAIDEALARKRKELAQRSGHQQQRVPKPKASQPEYPPRTYANIRGGYDPLSRSYY